MGVPIQINTATIDRTNLDLKNNFVFEVTINIKSLVWPIILKW